VVAGNTEGDPETEHAAADHGLSFPVAHSVPLEAAAALGAWTGVRQEVEHLQPCEFILRPDGTVAASLYATTQLGRMNPAEIIRFVSARK
jgi:peroxiredoxin